jgi:hypothetical protein
MINAATLRFTLRLGEVADEELTGILGTVFPLARWESIRSGDYFHPEQGQVLDVIYSKRGRILRLEPGPGLTPERIGELRKQVDAAFAQDAGVEVRRGLLFGMPPVTGFWRHGDDWQNSPLPRRLHGLGSRWAITRSCSSTGSAALRPSRSPSCDARGATGTYTCSCGCCSVGRITCETPEAQHHWVILSEPMPNGLQTAYGMPRCVLRSLRERRRSNARSALASELLARRRLPRLAHLEVAELHCHHQRRRGPGPQGGGGPVPRVRS